jgi:hypothetical protein
MNNVNVKGIFRYVTFGLRSDWVKFFFESNEVSLTNLGLGPKQILALYYYLKDAELIFDRNNFSSFYHYLIDIYKNEGINSKVLWSFLWVNLSFNSPMFIWWNNVRRENIQEKAPSIFYVTQLEKGIGRLMAFLLHLQEPSKTPRLAQALKSQSSAKRDEVER